MTQIKLLKVASDISAGRRGASLGPDAMRVAAWNQGADFFSKYEMVEVQTENHVLNKEPDVKVKVNENTITRFEALPTPQIRARHIHAKRIEALNKVLERTSQATAAILKEGQKPLVLAGDHATAAGTIAGIKAANPDKKIGAIWVDAHADLHTPYTTPSGNMHGFTLSMAAAQDNENARRRLSPPQRPNPVSPELKALWEATKAVGVAGPNLHLNDVVFIGVRDTEAEEELLMKDFNIPNFTVQQVREQGAIAIAEKALAHLRRCDLIYISFDIDSIDSAYVTGTGTPVDNGLSIDEARDINLRLIQDRRVAAWEIVEVNPTIDTFEYKNAYDYGNYTAEIGFYIMERVAANWR